MCGKHYGALTLSGVASLSLRPRSSTDSLSEHYLPLRARHLQKTYTPEQYEKMKSS